MDINSILTQVEAQAITEFTNAVAVEAAKLTAAVGPELAGLGQQAIDAVKRVFSGNLTAEQYAQLEALEQADIDETMANIDSVKADPNAS